ncbi:MAG: SRPBCC family protein [Chthonomonadaceae bacterium]|nr:SRPBCC family protein [Chthonomonadaceae bacterium]
MPKSEPQAVTGTVRLNRVFKCPPERIYKAVLDPAANCKWLPPNGFTCTVHELDAREGGRYKMTFTNFSTGSSHSFGGTYLELIPGERIVATDVFDDPDMPAEMRTTYTLNKVLCGTELSIVQHGIPAMITTDMCYLGWQESLDALARLVEPDIPDM